MAPPATRERRRRAAIKPPSRATAQPTPTMSNPTPIPLSAAAGRPTRAGMDTTGAMSSTPPERSANPAAAVAAMVASSSTRCARTVDVTPGPDAWAVATSMRAGASGLTPSLTDASRTRSGARASSSLAASLLTARVVPPKPRVVVPWPWAGVAATRSSPSSTAGVGGASGSTGATDVDVSVVDDVSAATGSTTGSAEGSGDSGDPGGAG